jgi:hypothetical protein
LANSSVSSAESVIPGKLNPAMSKPVKEIERELVIAKEMLKREELRANGLASLCRETAIISSDTIGKLEILHITYDNRHRVPG